MKRLASAAQLRPWPIHIFNQLGEIPKPPSTANKLSIAETTTRRRTPGFSAAMRWTTMTERRGRREKGLEDRTFLNPGNCDYAGLA